MISKSDYILIENFVNFFELEISKSDIQKYLIQISENQENSDVEEEVEKKRGRPKKSTKSCIFIIEKGKRKGEECGKNADVKTSMCIAHRKKAIDNDDLESVSVKSVKSHKFEKLNEKTFLELREKTRNLIQSKIDIKKLCNTIESDDDENTLIKKFALKTSWK